jgi:hypothetical protein
LIFSLSFFSILLLHMFSNVIVDYLLLSCPASDLFWYSFVMHVANFWFQVFQQIVSYLPTDADVFSYRHTCRSTFASISASVWRQRFIKKYDMVSGLDTDGIAQMYENRRKVMRERPIFDVQMHGHLLDDRMQSELTTSQQNFLIMLKDLLVGQ